MSKKVDRSAVFQSTRVRTSVKNDVCWIHKSKQEQEESRTDHAVETRPAFVKQNSYVRSTAKKFESIDSPLSPPLEKTPFSPFDGDSSNQAYGEVIPPQKDAQPEGSTLETTDDTKPQAPMEELIQKDEAHPEKNIANIPAENKEEYAAVYQSNVEQNGGAADVSAEVYVAEEIQNGEQQLVSSKEENPEAVSSVEPAEQTVANTTAENKGEITDKTVDQSNVLHIEANVSANAHVEDPVAETSAVPAVELKPKAEPATETEPANASQLEHAGGQSIVHPAEGSCQKGPPEQVAEEFVEAVAEVAVKSSPETFAVTGAAGENAALQVSVEPYPDLVADTASESPTKAAAETAIKPKESFVESAASAEPVLKTGAEEVVKCEVQPVDNTVVEQSVESTPEKAPDDVMELTIKDAVEPVTSLDAVEPVTSLDAVEPVTSLDAVEPVTSLDAVEPVTSLDAVEPVTSLDAVEPVTSLDAVEPVASLDAVEPVTSLDAVEPVTSLDAVEPVTSLDAVEPVTSLDAVKPVTSLDAVEPVTSLDAVEPVTSLDAVEPVTSLDAVEPVTSLDAVEPVTSLDAVEPVTSLDAVEPVTSLDAVEPVTSLDAVEPVTSLDADAAQDEFSDRLIELSEALDVEPPTTEAAPEPLKDPKQSHTEQTKLNQHSDDTNMSKEDPQSTQTQDKTRNSNVCSFCEKIIDGKVKIYLSKPAMTCHPECLKCGVCAMALGDMLTPMFLHNEVVQCGGCFAEALKTRT